MAIEEEYWQKFAASGAVADYLEYWDMSHAVSSQQIGRTIDETAGQNKRDRLARGQKRGNRIAFSPS